MFGAGCRHMQLHRRQPLMQRRRCFQRLLQQSLCRVLCHPVTHWCVLPLTQAYDSTPVRNSMPLETHLLAAAAASACRCLTASSATARSSLHRAPSSALMAATHFLIFFLRRSASLACSAACKVNMYSSNTHIVNAHTIRRIEPGAVCG